MDHETRKMIEEHEGARLAARAKIIREQKEDEVNARNEALNNAALDYVSNMIGANSRSKEVFALAWIISIIIMYVTPPMESHGVTERAAVGFYLIGATVIAFGAAFYFGRFKVYLAMWEYIADDDKKAIKYAPLAGAAAAPILLLLFGSDYSFFNVALHAPLLGAFLGSIVSIFMFFLCGLKAARTIAAAQPTQVEPDQASTRSE